MGERHILHCDMNCFYAAVEMQRQPELRDKPLAVCGSQEERHGIVLTANYIAKPYDIHLLRKRIHNLLKNREQIQKKFEKELKLESFGIQTEKDQSFFTQYTNLIKANFSNPDFNIDDICKELGISRANFYRKVKTQTGLSPAEMLRKLRLEVAAQMLRETELSIAEIQTKVAFSNSGYFASCFKQVYGMSPKEYRNANKM